MSTLPGRAPRSARSFLVAAGLLAGAAACGGGGDGGGNITPPPPNTNVTFNLAAQFVVAPTTTGLSVRATPAYELAAGGTRPLPAPAAVTLSSAAAQTVPVTVDIGSCLNDPARAGATTTGTPACRVVMQYTLLSGAREIDTQNAGTFVVAAGAPATAAALTFAEVTSVRVANAAGTALADGAALRAEVGTPVTLTATAVRADAATSARAVTWTSDNAAVAAVNPSTGVITPAAPGTARITAAVGDVRSTVVVTVVAAPAAVNLTVAGGSGSGGVSSSVGGLSCRVSAGALATSPCTANVPSDAPVTLTAAPDANAAFGGWGGDCASAGTALQCVLPASGGAPRNVTVRFNAQRTVTVSLAGTGVGRVTSVPAGIDCSTGTSTGCTGTFVEGQSVVLTATPVTNSTFTGWSGACAGTGTCQLTIGQNAAVTATFTGTPNPVPFTVTVAGPASPPYSIDLVYSGTRGGAPISSGLFTFQLSTSRPAPQLSLEADEGTQVSVTIRMSPSSPGRIVSWGGVCAGTTVTTPNATCTFRQTPNANVTVNVGP